MKYTRLFIFSVLMLAQIGVHSQAAIHYGSNNGKYVSIRNTKIYYEEYGNGTPLLMLHGGLGDISDFSLCIPILSKYFHVIIPDAPGLVKSEYSDSISYELLADYFSKFIDTLKLDHVFVIGWSDGANAALIMASERPDRIDRVLASGSNFKRSGFNFGDSNALKPIAADFRPDRGYQQWINEKFEADSTRWRKIINDRIAMWSKEIYFTPSLLQAIHIPVMIVVGDRDAVTLEHAVEMYRMIPGSQFCVLPNTSHAVFSERPVLISEIAKNFFEK